MMSAWPLSLDQQLIRVRLHVFPLVGLVNILIIISLIEDWVIC